MIVLLGPPTNGAITSLDDGPGIPMPRGRVPLSAESEHASV